MKNLTLLLFCFILCGLQAQTSLTICAGSNATLMANNPQNWTSPSYTLSPSLANNTTGSFVITPSITGIYTITLSGLNSSQVVQTQSTVYSVIVEPSLVSIAGPSMVTCFVPQITLTAQSANTALVYTWKTVGSPSTITGPTFAVNALTATPNGSLAGVFTLQAQDMNSNCTSTQTVLIVQNLYKPLAAISPVGNLSLTCYSPTLLVVNQSISGIPKNGGFTSPLAVVVQNWIGPLGATPTSQFYTVASPGTYTMTIMDMNNGCTSEKTFLVSDNIKYAGVNNPVAPPPANLCGNKTVLLVPIITTATTGLTYTWTSPSNAVVSGVNSQNLQTDSPGTYTLYVKTSYGCITQTTMSVVYCVGISGNSGLKTGDVFPNPAKNHITVSGLSHDSYTYWIYDIIGRSISTGKFTGTEITVSVLDLSSGTYLICLVNSFGMSETHKILKE